MQIDPRGPRFVAGVTSAVLALVLITGSPWLLVAQAAFFAVGAFAGITKSPYSWLFAHLVRPRLALPTELEDARPPQFAQLVGFVFATVGVAAFVLGAPAVAFVAVAAALGAAFLNAAYGYCLGCEMYLIGRRLLNRPVPAAVVD